MTAMRRCVRGGFIRGSADGMHAGQKQQYKIGSPIRMSFFWGQYSARESRIVSIRFWVMLLMILLYGAAIFADLPVLAGILFYLLLFFFVGSVIWQYIVRGMDVEREDQESGSQQQK